MEDTGRERFLALLSELTRLWKIEVYAYCLMDNHYHVLLQTPKGGLSRAMRHLDGIYTQIFNRSHHRDGPLFRGRYKSILIDAEKYFLSGGPLRWEKTSSVSSVCLRMKARAALERKIARRVRRIEEELSKSQERT